MAQCTLNSFAVTEHLMKWMELKWHGTKWKFKMFWRVLRIWNAFIQKFTCWRHWNTRTSSSSTIHGWTPRPKMWTSSLRSLPLALWGSKYSISYPVALASAEIQLTIISVEISENLGGEVGEFQKLLWNFGHYWVAQYFIVMRTLVCLEVLHVRENPFHLTPLHDWKLADSYFLVFNALAFNLCWIYDIIYLPDWWCLPKNCISLEVSKIISMRG